MKNKLGFGIFYAIVGALLCFGPRYIFSTCVLNPDKPMKCWWSTQAILGLGLIFIACGILYILIKSMEVRLGMSLMCIFTAIICILIPKFLIGGCKKETMACLSVEFPCIYLISVIAIIASLINIIYINKAIKGNR